MKGINYSQPKAQISARALDDTSTTVGWKVCERKTFQKYHWAWCACEAID